MSFIRHVLRFCGEVPAIPVAIGALVAGLLWWAGFGELVEWGLAIGGTIGIVVMLVLLGGLVWNRLKEAWRDTK